MNNHLDRRQVENALERKGFRRSNSDHRKFIYYESQRGTKTGVWTKTSHGGGYKNISTHNLHQMAKQCAISLRQFLDLVECPLSRMDYEQLLVEKGKVKR